LAGAALSIAAWDAGLGLGSGLSVGLSPHCIGDGGGGTGDQATHQVPNLFFIGIEFERIFYDYLQVGLLF
jgi:hypothetical protein